MNISIQVNGLSRRWVIGIASLILLVVSAACYNTPTSTRIDNSILGKDQNTTNQYYQVLRTSVPYPTAQMKYSLERANIRERLLRFNQPDKIGYVYLLSQTGQVMSYYTIKGKVSNPDSQMTAADQVEQICFNAVSGGGYTCSMQNLTSPGDDGSFGPNERGIFFFTTEDVLVESSLDYVYSDTPLRINDQRFIIYDASTAKPTSVGESVETRKERAAQAEAAPLPTAVPTATARPR